MCVSLGCVLHELYLRAFYGNAAMFLSRRLLEAGDESLFPLGLPFRWRNTTALQLIGPLLLLLAAKVAASAGNEFNEDRRWLGRSIKRRWPKRSRGDFLSFYPLTLSVDSFVFTAYLSITVMAKLSCFGKGFRSVCLQRLRIFLVRKSKSVLQFVRLALLKCALCGSVVHIGFDVHSS
jgi:hypothetical protein